jgi:ABC-type branched-subunit amino acid transport system substrate-binding protein
MPVTGPYQAFGERVLQGIQLALQEQNGPGRPPLVGIVLRDSKDQPRDAEQAIEDLAGQPRVLAIIGPLMSPQVERAAKKAREVRVPLITLSQKEPLPERNDFLFQNSLTPSAQVQTLADFAVRELELQTFAVFYPSTPYGAHLRSLFSQEVTRRGAKMLGAVAYQEGQTDFSKEIREFFRVETVKKYPLHGKKEEEFIFTRLPGGVFIPDSHDQAGLILAQMAFYGGIGLTPLGTSAWNHPDLVSLAGKGAEGATFVDAFFKKSESRPVGRFVEDFRKAWHRDPETLEALGYDTMKYLIELLKARPVSSPSQLREELSKARSFEGVTGLKGFGEGGKAIRSLFVLRVKNGRFEQIAP